MAIKHKRKSTSAYTWSSLDLADGQIGLNTADGTVHIKKTDNSIVTIGAGGVVMPSTTPYVPLTINTGDTFTVPENTQILHAKPIKVDGSLNVIGDLVEINPNSIAVNAQVPQLIPSGGLFTIGSNKQVAFNEDIIVAGNLEVFGDLIDTIKSPTGVTSGTYSNATITVDALGKISYAASGAGPSAAGSTYNIQRNSYGSFYGTSDLNYDTSASTHWFNVNTSGNFLASFGANNRNPELNSTKALFFSNTTNGVLLRTSNSNYSSNNSDYTIQSGSSVRTSGYPAGGNFIVTSGNGTSGYGYTYSASGGRFDIYSGTGDCSNSTNNNVFGQGGDVRFYAGEGKCNNTQSGSNGGALVFYAGTAYKGYATAGGASIYAGNGSINGSTYIPGDIILGAGTNSNGTRGKISLYSSQLILGVLGQGISITEGTNAKQGIATLVSGTVTISNTSVTANSRIFLTTQDPNSGTPGFLWISARTPGTDFTIQSSSILDTSIVAYEIFEPS
jgi:hypothetical protein